MKKPMFLILLFILLGSNNDMPQEIHPIENILVLSKMSVQFGLSGGTFFIQFKWGMFLSSNQESLPGSCTQKNCMGVYNNFDFNHLPWHVG
jgi:hypothetical protein